MKPLFEIVGYEYETSDIEELVYTYAYHYESALLIVSLPKITVIKDGLKLSDKQLHTIVRKVAKKHTYVKPRATFDDIIRLVIDIDSLNQPKPAKTHVDRFDSVMCQIEVQKWSELN